MEDFNDTIWWPDFCGNATALDAFWNPAVSINTARPDVTTCFRQTALVWLPAVWLAAAGPFYLYGLATRPRVNTCWQWSLLNALKVAISFILLLVVFFSVLPVLITDIEGITHYPPASYVSVIIEIITMALTTFIMRWEYIKGVHSHGVSVILWFLLFICDIVQFLSSLVRLYERDMRPTLRSSLTMAHFAGTLLGLFLQLFSDRKALGPNHFANQPGDEDSSEGKPLLDVRDFQQQNYKVKQTPELHAPWLLRITHWWITRELFFGLGTKVTFKNLYDIKPVDKAEDMIRRLRRHLYSAWGSHDRPKDAAGTDVPFPLVRCLTFTIGQSLLLGVCLRIVSIVLDLSNSFLLRVLVQYVESNDPYTWKGVFIASTMLVVAFCSCLLLHNFYNLFWITGMRTRSICNTLVFQKAMRLSVKAKRDSTLGEIINLMSVDGQKLQDVFFTSSHIWEVPIDVILCMLALDNTIGVSCLAGLGVILILIPVVGVVLSYRIRKLQIKQMQAKDSRIKYISEVLDSIKIIKLYGWEPPFVTRVHDTREDELNLVRSANVTGAISSILSILCPYLVSLAIYTAYILTGPNHYMTPDKAFGTVAVINVLYYPVSRIPTSIFATAQAYVSIKRTSRFLNLEEAEDMTTSSDNAPPGLVNVNRADFSWERGATPTLKSISLLVPPGTLVAVVGRVGSGKSSLLSALLGEMLITEGSAEVGGRLGYVPQEPWILHTTVRENVLFGKDMRRATYQETLDACALQPDLALLDGGDMAEIAEKGDNLSGGQRARVSLARAVYSDADVYLLDDPLSAVDASVGKHIFNNVIGPQGMLKDKTRLFVTHSMTFVNMADLVVLLDEGEVREVGTFDKLMDEDREFASMYNNAINNPEDDVDSLITTEGMASGEYTPIKAPQRLMTEEIPKTGNVDKKVVWEYIRSGGIVRFVLMVAGMALYVVSQVGGYVWLSDWSSDREAHILNTNSTLKYTPHWRLAVYGVLVLAQGVTIGIVLFSIAYGCVAAARAMHGNMLSRVVRAPMAFFDTTPMGRVINRFSKDMDIIDTNMFIYIAIWLVCLAPIAAALVAISYTVPILLIMFGVLAVIYFVVQRVYMNYFRQLRRIDSVQRSPVYTHFYETLVGTASVKAYRRQQDFINKCYQLVDESQRAWYLIIVTRRWMGVTMDSLGCLILFFTALFVTLHRESVGAGLAGMAVTYALQIIYLQNKLIRFSTELETYLTSIERIHEYSHMPQEAAWKDPGLSPPDIWPYNGYVEFLNYSTRYREGLDNVLSNINLNILPGEKVGVVGRTGAGKSSLLLALFRIIEPSEGRIVVDGLQITCLGLHDVRSRFAIIPQVPAIFTGTLRMNLDPYKQYKDEELWKALESVRLKDTVTEWASCLNLQIGETGHNLSLGQRQLVCLARVLLRKPKVLVLDEATAAVDLETDEFLQKTIRSQFADCTVITIAHRLTTVLDYDKILVMDAGHICEFNSPEVLLSDPLSRFHQMARQAGIINGSSTRGTSSRGASSRGPSSRGGSTPGTISPGNSTPGNSSPGNASPRNSSPEPQLDINVFDE